MTDIEIKNLQQQIITLGERMEKGFDELKRMISGMDERVRGVENKEANCNPLVMLRLNEVEKDVDQTKKDVVTLKDIVGKLEHTNKILSWILAIMTAVGTSVLIAFLNSRVGL